MQKKNNLIFFTMRAKKEVKENEKEVAEKILLRQKRRKLLRITILSTILLLIAAGLIFTMTTKITTVEVVGSEHYSEEEIKGRILSEEKDYLTVYALYNGRFGTQKDIPFIEKYTIRVTGLHSMKLLIYEKSLAGCVEYMGSYMYFDSDGVVVESSGEHEPEVPVITGLKYKNIILYEQLSVEDPSIFTEILNISQLLQKHELIVDSVDFHVDGTVDIRIGTICCVLGANKNLAEKIAEFSDMLPKLEGLSGTVYLNEYDPAVKNPSYRFIPG